MLDAFTHCAPNLYFDATDGELLVGGRKVSAIAAESGRTPFYAYGSAVMTRKVQELRAAMPARPTDPLRHEGESDAGRRQALLRAGRWYRRRLSRRDGCGNRCRPSRLPSPPLRSVQPTWSGSRQRHRKTAPRCWTWPDTSFVTGGSPRRSTSPYGWTTQALPRSSPRT
jgi:hypothetical protein